MKFTFVKAAYFGLALGAVTFSYMSHTASAGEQGSDLTPEPAWTLMVDGNSEMMTVPSLMQKDVCVHAGRAIIETWRKDVLCLDVTTGRIIRVN